MPSRHSRDSHPVLPRGAVPLESRRPARFPPDVHAQMPNVRPRVHCGSGANLDKFPGYRSSPDRQEGCILDPWCARGIVGVRTYAVSPLDILFSTSRRCRIPNQVWKTTDGSGSDRQLIVVVLTEFIIITGAKYRTASGGDWYWYSSRGPRGMVVSVKGGRHVDASFSPSQPGSPLGLHLRPLKTPPVMQIIVDSAGPPQRRRRVYWDGRRG